VKGYTTMIVELPACPKIARIIWKEQKRLYINAAAEPGANIDYLVNDRQVCLFLSPNGKLPDGAPK
jgi:hypothetical protein